MHAQPGKFIFGDDGWRGGAMSAWEDLEGGILGDGPPDSSQPLHQNFALCLFLGSYFSVPGTLQDPPAVVQHAMHNQPPALFIKTGTKLHLIGVAARTARVGENLFLLCRSIEVVEPLRVTELRNDVRPRGQKLRIRDLVQDDVFELVGSGNPDGLL